MRACCGAIACTPASARAERAVPARHSMITYGDTAAAIVADGLYVLSWAQASGTVSGDPEAINHRYWGVDDELRALAESYLRIDADWNTVALDINTGELRWQRSEPSAAMNFLSNKRDHNGVDPAAGAGIYVTVSSTGHVFAYDLTDGSLRWQSTVGPWHESAAAVLRRQSAVPKRVVTTQGLRPYGPSGHLAIGQAPRKLLLRALPYSCSATYPWSCRVSQIFPGSLRIRAVFGGHGGATGAGLYLPPSRG